ncbi:thiol reductant ABC exporter subunit CydC [Actinopolymorpha pittospori]|uniref:Thiol reductant ABC exporter CydC subunit n=1 Tax=Actinopolymorpha pittospori TaxID=648752 RepID=A0A927MV11_9ACTN|nr:thiol reductant ABC exporter subunit CydC [Actinopolymorpha pittospori]MBE1606734.1 thiol reductant ABC exporter CydC subunit [Actinopolymorpha pittospori]
MSGATATGRGAHVGRRAEALRWLAGAARPELLRLLLAALLGSLALGASVGLVATAAWLISRATEQPPVVALTVAVVAVRTFGIGRGVLRYCERLVSHDAAFRVMARTRVRVYIDLERAAPAGLGRLRSGDVLARLVGDVEAVQNLLVRGLLPIGVAILTGAGCVIFLAALLPAAGGVLLAGLLLGGVGAPAAALITARRADRELAPARGALSGSVVEFLHGAADLTAHRAAQRWLDRLDDEDRHLTRLAQRGAAGAGVAAACTVAATGLTVVGELLVGVPALASGQLSGVTLAVLALTPLAAFEVTAPLPLAASELLRGMRAVDRLRALTELPHPAASDGVRPAPLGALTLDVRGLTVRWPGADAPALTDIDLCLRPGRRVAIVGESGAGKSTLVTALQGFLPTESGSIQLIGTDEAVDLADLEDGARRRVVAACAQDAHLFDSTIRSNLLIARPDATQDQVAGALDRARMWRWVGRQPRRLDTSVGERGVRLSGGERQRLMLARALLADPAVLLLDEPTAHLDDATASTLMRDLLVATQGRTTLLVTHRLAGLSLVDEIVVLSGGQVVQRGVPAELIQTDGPYRRMWLRSAAKEISSQDAPTMEISAARLNRPR